ncbi:hypothetical protein GCM10008024_12030 [Allgaiera indica]|uniref:Uncharacterized protein n=1 Tax=Allgaiera indica TaxID=765699 RepID=A0AAN4UQ75_9RHOB|nr:hypothetical protein GCM10008024_12030 [Allgaiera indica]
MIEDRVEGVAFQPLLMVDQAARSAQLLDEHPIPQALRGEKVFLVTGKAQLEMRVVRNHGQGGVGPCGGGFRQGGRRRGAGRIAGF